jgi:hypothetical protein
VHQNHRVRQQAGSYSLRSRQPRGDADSFAFTPAPT